MTEVGHTSTFCVPRKAGVAGKELLMALEFTPKSASMTMTVLSDQFPKGKRYTFSHLANNVTGDQIELITSAVEELFDGKAAETQIHKTEVVGEAQ